MDLTEAEDIKKRWQEHTEEQYKKDLHDPDNHNGVITHLEPDILECEVKWALGRITKNKASGGDGIPVELFQILKDAAVTVLGEAHRLKPPTRPGTIVTIPMSCFTTGGPGKEHGTNRPPPTGRVRERLKGDTVCPSTSQNPCR